MSPLSIADVVASQVPLDWTEAVAIMGELCAIVLAADAAATRIPDAADVVLLDDGTLAVGARAQEHDVTYGARLLHALLAAATTPAPLRLFVSRSISSNQHTSVGEFADALAYYERPGRPHLLQKVFERCLSAPRQGGESSILLPSEPTAPPAMRMRRRIPRRMALTASVVAAFVIGGSALWVSGVRVSPRSMRLGGLNGLFGQAGDAIASLSDRIRSDLGFPIVRPEQPSEPVVNAQARAVVPRTRRSVQLPVPGALPDPNVPAVATDTTIVGAAPETAAPAAPAAVLATPPVGEAPDLQVYSSDAADVTPAVLEDQSRARLATTPEPSPTVNRIEVTVDRSGEVRRVKLVKGPSTMNDVMLLSAVKAWKFRPAQRNGQPVSYRVVLDWPMQQQVN